MKPQERAAFKDKTKAIMHGPTAPGEALLWIPVEYRALLIRWQADFVRLYNEDVEVAAQLLNEVRTELGAPQTGCKRLHHLFFNSLLPQRFVENSELNYSEEFMALVMQDPVESEKEDYSHTMNFFADLFEEIEGRPDVIRRNNVNRAKYLSCVYRATQYMSDPNDNPSSFVGLVTAHNDFLENSEILTIFFNYLWLDFIKQKWQFGEKKSYLDIERKWLLTFLLKFSKEPNIVLNKILSILDGNLLTRVLKKRHLIYDLLAIGHKSNLKLNRALTHKEALTHGQTRDYALVLGQASRHPTSIFSRLPLHLCENIAAMASEGFSFSDAQRLAGHYARWANVPTEQRANLTLMLKYRHFIECDVAEREPKIDGHGNLVYSRYKSRAFDESKEGLSICSNNPDLLTTFDRKNSLATDLTAIVGTLKILIDLQQEEGSQIVRVGDIDNVITHKYPQLLLKYLPYLIKNKLFDDKFTLTSFFTADIHELHRVLAPLIKLNYDNRDRVLHFLRCKPGEARWENFVTLVNFYAGCESHTHERLNMNLYYALHDTSAEERNSNFKNDFGRYFLDKTNKEFELVKNKIVIIRMLAELQSSDGSYLLKALQKHEQVEIVLDILATLHAKKLITVSRIEDILNISNQNALSLLKENIDSLIQIDMLEPDWVDLLIRENGCRELKEVINFLSKNHVLSKELIYAFLNGSARHVENSPQIYNDNILFALNVLNDKKLLTRENILILFNHPRIDKVAAYLGQIYYGEWISRQPTQDELTEIFDRHKNQKPEPITTNSSSQIQQPQTAAPAHAATKLLKPDERKQLEKAQEDKLAAEGIRVLFKISLVVALVAWFLQDSSTNSPPTFTR